MSGESSVYSLKPTYHYQNFPTQDTPVLASTVPVYASTIPADLILNRLDSIETTVESLKPKTWTIFTPTLSGIYSAMEKVATGVKHFLLGDGGRLLGAMVAVLSTAAIMRKYPDIFAIPVLKGTSATSYRDHVYNRPYHNW